MGGTNDPNTAKGLHARLTKQLGKVTAKGNQQRIAVIRGRLEAFEREYDPKAPVVKACAVVDAIRSETAGDNRAFLLLGLVFSLPSFAATLMGRREL